MRTLLVYPDFLPSVHSYRGYFNQGVSCIASVLQKAGHDVKLLHLFTPPRLDRFAQVVKTFDPAIVGISSTTNQFGLAHQVAEWTRAIAPAAVIVLGGIHSTLNADRVIRLEEFDMVCRGEGEFPMLHLAGRLEKGEDWEDTPNMWIRRKDGTIRKNASLPLVANLDDLPWPSRDVWDYPSLQMESRGYATVMFSRGCPHRCTYCCNYAISRIYREGGEKRYFRIRSAASAIAELKWIKQTYTFVTMFNFDDDNLFLDLRWAREFAERYVKEVGLPFTCNLYPGLINEERVELLTRAGCIDLRIGLESGNEDIRVRLLGRRISNEDMRRAYRICREAGLSTRSFVMVGLPDETPDTILDTVRLLAEAKVGIAQSSIFFPYEGTALYDYCAARGYLPPEDSGDADYLSRSVLNLDTISKEQVLMFRNYLSVFVMLYRLVDLLPRAARGRAERILRRMLLARRLPKLLNPLTGGLPYLKFLKGLTPHRVPQADSKKSRRGPRAVPAEGC